MLSELNIYKKVIEPRWALNMDDLSIFHKIEKNYQNFYPSVFEIRVNNYNPYNPWIYPKPYPLSHPPHCLLLPLHSRPRPIGCPVGSMPRRATRRRCLASSVPNVVHQSGPRRATHTGHALPRLTSATVARLAPRPPPHLCSVAARAVARHVPSPPSPTCVCRHCPLRHGPCPGAPLLLAVAPPEKTMRSFNILDFSIQLGR